MLLSCKWYLAKNKNFIDLKDKIVVAVKKGIPDQRKKMHPDFTFKQSHRDSTNKKTDARYTLNKVHIG